MATIVSENEPASGETPTENGGRWSWGPSFQRGELIAVALVLATYALLTVGAIVGGAPLGHDEAVYSLRSVAFAEGTSSVSWYWGDQRALGLPWLLHFVIPIGDTAPYLRLGVAALTAVAVVVTWLIGRYLFSRAIGIIAAAGLTLTSLWITIGSSVWPDGPGAALALAAISVLLFATSGRKISWWILLAIPLAVGATLIRYGEPLALAIAGVAILAWRRHLLNTSRPQIVGLALGAGIPLAMIVFTPLVTSARSPYQANAAFVARNAPSPVDGWNGYVRILGNLLTQPLFVLLAIGLVAAWWAPRRFRSATLLCASIAFFTFAGLASALHAEPRYLAPVLPWLWVVGAVGLWVLGRALSSGGRIAVAISTILLMGFTTVVATSDSIEAAKENFGVLKEASTSYEWTPGCVIATTYGPQVGWYSGCRAVPFNENDDNLFGERANYAMWLLAGKRQPEAFDNWRQEARPGAVSFGDPNAGSLQYIEVFDLTR